MESIMDITEAMEVMETMDRNNKKEFIFRLL